jgi:hypothetical protein
VSFFEWLKSAAAGAVEFGSQATQNAIARRQKGLMSPDDHPVWVKDR